MAQCFSQCWNRLLAEAFQLTGDRTEIVEQFFRILQQLQKRADCFRALPETICPRFDFPIGCFGNWLAGPRSFAPPAQLTDRKTSHKRRAPEGSVSIVT